MKPHHGKPRRGMTKVASRFNGWYSGDGYKRAFRYATTTLWCRVPKGTLSTDTDKPAIEMAGCRCLMPTASAVRNLLNLYFYSHAEALSFSQSQQFLNGVNRDDWGGRLLPRLIVLYHQLCANLFETLRLCLRIKRPRLFFPINPASCTREAQKKKVSISFAFLTFSS